MEDVFRRSGHRVVSEEEKRDDSVGDHKDEIVAKEPVVTNMEGSSLGPDSKASSSSLKKDEDDQLESARAEMGEVREENQRLKMYLDRVMKDYQTLQMQFYDVVQQEAKKSKDVSNDHQGGEEPELVSLSLGRIFSSDSKNDEKGKSSSQGKDQEEHVKKDLSLGLDYKYAVSKSEGSQPLPKPSPANSSEEQKEEDTQTSPSGKAVKTMRSEDDEILQQNPLKKARVSVRARCDTPTMNDGCQWRKYGQKIAKGNPCPRAYYRCTVAPSCPVRKQVQRCAEDMSILISTYEGTHNHPLPVSATAMASTTSAAASMLLSGSSSSSRPGTSAPSSVITANTNHHGLNFYLTDNSRSKQFYLPNPSLSSSPSYPTITLDLTTAPNSSSSHFNRFNSNYTPSARYNSSTSLSFSPSGSNSSMSWSSGLLSYGSTQPDIKNQIGPLNLGRQAIENFYGSYMQKNNPNTPQQALSADTIAAATKAITADPSFQSALVAALTSIIGTGNGGGSGGASQVGGGETFLQKLKWGEHFPVASTYSETVKGSGCASSYLNKSSTTTSPAGSLIFLPPSLPFSSSKSASASPVDDIEHNN